MMGEGERGSLRENVNVDDTIYDSGYHTYNFLIDFGV